MRTNSSGLRSFWLFPLKRIRLITVRLCLLTARCSSASGGARRAKSEVKTVYHQPPGDPRPKRGDLLQSNIGNKHERTWLVLAVHILPTRWCHEMGITAQRSRVWAERWWALEPEMRMTLFRSAERAGGQMVHPFQRFPAKRKPTFERLMRLEK
jgi:hypothetical protein